MRTDRSYASFRRRGSVSLETVLTLPLVVVLAVLSQYVAETMIFRDATGAVARLGAYAHAADEGCAKVRAGDVGRDGVERSIRVACRPADDERGLTRTPRFFVAMDRASSDYPGLIRDVRPSRPLYGAEARADGGVRIESPPFLANFDETATSELSRAPYAARWAHTDEPWRRGYDPTIRRTLASKGTHQLFPRVFPAHNSGR